MYALTQEGILSFSLREFYSLPRRVVHDMMLIVAMKNEVQEAKKDAERETPLRR